MEKLIGIDVGYGFVKISDGEVGYSFPSIIGEARKGLKRIELKKLPALDDLKVEINNKSYHVGSAAIRNSPFAYRDLSSLTSDSLYFQVLFFTALSFYCTKPITTFNIVSGLPVSAISNTDTLISLIKTGARLSKTTGGNSKEYDIRINHIEIVPQPLGTYWSEFLDGWGQELEAPESRIGVVDIGHRTSDLITVIDSEYITEKSGSYNIGMTTAMNDIIHEIHDKFGFEQGTYSMEEVVATKKIKLSGELIDVANIVDNALDKLAANTLANINSLWRIGEYDKILLSGGGCQATGSYLLPKLKQAKIVDDPMTANCIGFLNWANHLWRNDETDQ